jgi:hypothetical protein
MDPTKSPSSEVSAQVRARIVAFALVGLLVLNVNGCTRESQPSASLSHGSWSEFTGTWIAAGSRDTVRLGGDRRASINSYDGSLVLAGPARPGAGFRAEAITFNDSTTGIVGRAVWTDERGNKVYSELSGGTPATGGKIIGNFVGGTGRYAGATGTYEFSWQFLIETEDGNVQGKSSEFSGRIRVASPGVTSQAGGIRS